MKKYFWVISLCAACCLNHLSFGQDTIKTKSGEEIKARVLKMTRKETTYKSYDDPEFSTYTLPYKELSSIKKEGEKKPILFNHRLARAYLGLSIAPPGLARPMGSFAGTDYEEKGEPGFAGEGSAFKLDFGVYLWKNLGLAISTGYSWYKFGYEEYRDLYDVTGPGIYQFMVDQGYSNGRLKDTRWTFKQIMLGPVYSIKIGKRITQDIKAQVGFIETWKPDLHIFLNTYNGTFSERSEFYYSAAEKTELSYNLGTSTRVALSRRLAWYLAANFTHTSPQMDIEISQSTTTTTTTVSYSSSRSNTKIRYDISTLNLSMGFVFQFKRKKNKFE